MKKSILVVEDHEGNANTIRDYIHTFFPKMLVYNAITGRDAIDKTLSQSPDVIILDISLADQISGVRVVQDIAKAGKAPRIILITALDDHATDGPRPGRPWMEQFEPNEKKLIVGFFHKSRLSWAEFVRTIAKAAEVDAPEGIDNL